MVAKLIFDRAIDGDREAQNFIVDLVADALTASKPPK